MTVDTPATTEDSTQPLTLLQTRFIDAYLGDANGNATRAARLAGYAGDDNALAVEGHRTLRNAKVRAEIERRMGENQSSASEVLSRLSDVARGVGGFMTVTAEGKATLDVRALLTAGKGHMIKSVRGVGNEQVIEFYDALAANVQLGRYHKLFTDKINIAGLDEAIEEQLAAAISRRDSLGGSS